VVPDVNTSFALALIARFINFDAGFRWMLHDNDPPQLESRAAYLKRLGLFLASEERRLEKADWDADTVSKAE
jgi:hypothetical protein